MILPEGYFEEGQILLPGMDEKMELHPGVLFRYDGEVDSLPYNIVTTELILQGKIEATRNRIQQVLDRPFINAVARMFIEKRPDLAQTAAYCLPYKISKRRTAYVIAKKKLEKSKSIFADGHESGEFLRLTERREVLQNALNSEGIDLDCSKFEGEDFADIGGMLALFRAVKLGQNLIELPKFNNRNAVLDAIRRPFNF